MNPTRRLFLGKSLSLVFGVAVINSVFSTGCKGSDGYGGDSAIPVDANPQSGDCSAGGRNVTYQNPGHSHSAINLPKEMVEAAAPGFYELLAGSHTHDFELTAADFIKLKNGETINKQEADHGHIVAISC